MTADGRTPERKVSELDLGEKRGMLEIGFRQFVLSSTLSAFPSTPYNSIRLYYPTSATKLTLLMKIRTNERVPPSLLRPATEILR